MASPPSTYRVIAEGDDDVARGLAITDALAVAEFARGWPRGGGSASW